MVKRFSEYLSFITIFTTFVSEKLAEGQTRITVYPGSSNQLEFYIYEHPLTWREARNGCEDDNLRIMGTWMEGLTYVKNVVLNNQGWSHDGFWIGYIHYPGEVEYERYGGSCGDDVSSAIKVLINGFDISIRQCLYINTSSPNSDDTNIFAGLCELKMPYLCTIALGHFSGDPNSTVEIVKKRFKSQDDINSFPVADLNACIDKLFGSYINYAAEFDNSTQSCRVKRAAHVSDFPIVFEVDSTTNGEIILYKNTKPVVFRSIVKNVIPNDWPCWNEPTTSVTTYDDQYSTSPSFMYSSPYSQNSNESCCACHSTKPYGPLKLLDKRSLSRFKMKKISASDSRVSATTIGCLGAVTLITVCCVIISADIHSIFTNMKRKKHD